MIRSIYALTAVMGALEGGVLVTFEAAKASDGFSWDYTLTAANRCLDCPVSGLLVLKGDTVFALLAASEITPPDDWDYMWPIPGVVDDLSYFSTKPEADLKKGASLVFTFNSITGPGGLKPEDLLVDVICRDTGEQIRAKSALVPEPHTAILVLSALLAPTLRRRRPAVPRP
jgi:hypothetical protein